MCSISSCVSGSSTKARISRACVNVSCWHGPPLVGCSWPSGSLFPWNNMRLQSLTIRLLPAYMLLSSGFYLGRCFLDVGMSCSWQPRQGPRGIDHSSAIVRKAASRSRYSCLVGYWDQKGRLTIISSLSGPKEHVHIAVGGKERERKRGGEGKEGRGRKGNCAISRIFKGEIIWGGREDGKMYLVLWKRQLKPRTECWK